MQTSESPSAINRKGRERNSELSNARQGTRVCNDKTTQGNDEERNIDRCSDLCQKKKRNVRSVMQCRWKNV